MDDTPQRDQLDLARAESASSGGLYELWDAEELRRHVAVLEAELQRLIPFVRDAQAELHALRRWKADVEASRSWRLAKRLAGLRRLQPRARGLARGR